MANVYQKISELDRLDGELKNTDIFITSRPDEQNTRAYQSYGVTYDKLSSDVREKIINVLHEYYADVDKLGLVNSYSGTRTGGKRIVQEGVIAEIRNRLDGASSSSYLDKSTSSQQTVSGPVTFTGDVEISRDPTDEDDAVNKKYVDEIAESLPEQVYYTRKGAQILKQYTLVSQSAYDDPDNDLIYTGKSNPIIFYNDEDRMLQVMFVGKSKSRKYLGIFTYDTSKGEDSYDEVRNELVSKFSSGNLDNVNMIHIFQEDYDSTSSNSIKVVSLSVRAGTWLVFSNGLATETEKKTFTVYDINKRYHSNQNNKHISTPGYYTDSSGYSYHYESYQDGCGRTRYKKVYDRDANGKKRKLYSQQEKQLYTTVYDVIKATFTAKDCLTISAVV